jgi:non-specific serine/threonine protein kinase
MRDAVRSEAVTLFVERARQADPRFELRGSNCAGVIEICRRLDELPLAIELAAARVAVMDLKSIGEQLDDRFRFLTGGFRTAAQRQRTLRAALDWSFDLLTAAERELFARLAVFAGGFDTAAVQAVCPGGSVLRSQVLEVLGRLIDKSLVTAVDPAEEPRRYRLLETLRAYGLDRLREGGKLESMRRRHAEYLSSFGDVSLQVWDTAEWLVRMQRDVDNFREALSWSRAADPALHLRLAASYGWLCMRSGFVGEGTAWLEPALQLGAEASTARAQADLTMALLAWRQNDIEAADRFASEAVSIRRELKDDTNLGEALGTLAFVRVGTFSAREAIQELLSIAQRLGVPQMEADALTILAFAEAIDMDLDTALEHFSRSVALYEAGGVVPAVVCNGLGWVLLMLHRPAEAAPVVARGLLIRLRTRDVIDLAGSLDASAEIAFELGAQERAMRLKGATDAIRARAGSALTVMAERSRDRWVSRAERALGKSGAHAAWLEGGRLSPEEAGAYALAPLDQPPPRSGAVPNTTLSSRENEVAGLVAGGLTNDEIAGRLRLSRRTVEAHLDHIRTKLGVRSRVEVATWVTSPLAGEVGAARRALPGGG